MPRRSRCDRWGAWSCGAFVWGTAALAYGIVLTGAGWTLDAALATLLLFPVWMTIWAILLGALWWPALIAFALVGLCLDAAERRRVYKRPLAARAATEGAF